jgi:hypothetical protein
MPDALRFHKDSKKSRGIGLNVHAPQRYRHYPASDHRSGKGIIK